MSHWPPVTQKTRRRMVKCAVILAMDLNNKFNPKKLSMELKLKVPFNRGNYGYFA